VSYETYSGIKLRVNPPPWPKLDDTYRRYYVFCEKLIAYIRQYCEGHTANIIADFFKDNCLSSKVLQYVSHMDSLDKILSIHDSLFSRLNKLMESIMQSMRDHPRVAETNWAQCLSYYSLV
jgi:hypothetical protein